MSHLWANTVSSEQKQNKLGESLVSLGTCEEPSCTIALLFLSREEGSKTQSPREAVHLAAVHLAAVHLAAAVPLNMGVIVALVGEAALAVGAVVGALPGVFAHMHVEIVFPGSAVGAPAALEHPGTVVLWQGAEEEVIAEGGRKTLLGHSYVGEAVERFCLPGNKTLSKIFLRPQERERERERESMTGKNENADQCTAIKKEIPLQIEEQIGFFHSFNDCL